MGSSSSSEASGDIRTLIESDPIVVFSSSGCPYCRNAISSLESAGYKPKVVQVTFQQRQELYAMTNSRSVPNIWLKGKFVGGCNDGPEPWMGINKILKEGKMDQYLQ